MDSSDDFAMKRVHRLAFENGRFRQLIQEAIESMDYAQVFLCSREKMDDSRRSRWVSLLNEMAAAIEETEPLDNKSAKLVGEGGMMDNRIASQKATSDAENLLREPLDLIRQVLVKFETACVGEWRVIVEARKEETRRIAAERDAIADLNHAQFLELEYLRAVFKAADKLYFESEEYNFDDGMGRGVQQLFWDDLGAALETKTDAQSEVLGEQKS